MRVAALSFGPMTLPGMNVAVTAILLSNIPSCVLAQSPEGSGGAIASTTGLRPDIAGQMERPLRYPPDNGDFVITNGTQFFNRSLYGGNTAFRVDGGDKSEFMMYLPGRGGNLRLGVHRGGHLLWLMDAAQVVTRYRPGELLYEVRDPAFGPNGMVSVEVLPYASTEGLIFRAQATDMAPGAALMWAYGGVNGQRGTRDGDIGTERVPISQYFQLQPAFAEDNRFAIRAQGFTLQSKHADIVGIVPPGALQRLARAEDWNALPALFAQGSPAAILCQPDRPIVAGEAAFAAGHTHKDVLGRQMIHPDYGLWNFYHTVDEEATTRKEAWLMGADLQKHFRPIPVIGPAVPKDLPYHVFSETDSMPYSWSINNVVMDENLHTALWQSGHSSEAYVLAKGGILASMFMGISPGNVGTMDYIDAYRRESQRDFGDSAGAMSRALIEGLFGIHPDALAGVLTLSPGFPDSWDHARLTDPDLGVDFLRHGLEDTWTITQSGARFHQLKLRVSPPYDDVERVQVNGVNAAWKSEPDGVGHPLLMLNTPAAAVTKIQIIWKGARLDAPAIATASSDSSKTASDGFTLALRGAFRWWAMEPKIASAVAIPSPSTDWNTPQPVSNLESVDLTSAFNDSVDAIFAEGKYLSPRSTGVSLALPWQGVGAWAGHLKLLPKIDDEGLRRTAAAHGDRLIMPNGVFFRTPGHPSSRNILFTSQWDNYPHEAAVLLSGLASHAYL